MAARWNDYPPYVPVAERRAQHAQRLRQMVRDGKKPRPVTGHGRRVALSFWGSGWCRHLESFSDFENRLPRGRRYLNQGAVLHLDIEPGLISAVVSGTSLYRVAVEIEPLAKHRWRTVRKACAGQIGSLLEVLRGELSDDVMTIVADRKQGLFPQPREISLSCSCPDWAEMCKHVAAALYGVGARLDEEPGLLFRLRGVDPGELATGGLVLAPTDPAGEADDGLDSDDLAGIFGIELAAEPVAAPRSGVKAKPKPKPKSKPKLKPKASAGQQASFQPTAAFVTALRADFGLSVAELADVLGTTPASVYRWEAAKGELKLRSRTTETLRRLSELRADLLARGWVR